MLISIVIPVYNTEKYIERCLNSVLLQEYEDYEVIIVNDGSTDGSEQIIKSIIEKNPGKLIKIIKQENKGLSEARNRGTAEASGKYIIWLDSDDSLADGALAKLEVLLKKEPDIAICRIASFEENSGTITPCDYSFSDNRILNANQAISVLNRTKGFWYAAWCIIPRRELLLSEGIRFAPGLYHEDELWTPTVIVVSKRICFFNECYYLNTSFRQGSIITKHNIKKEFDKIEICKTLKSRALSVKDERRGFINKRILIIMYTIFASMSKYKEDNRYWELKNSFNAALKNIYGIKSSLVWLVYYIKKSLS